MNIILKSIIFAVMVVKRSLLKNQKNGPKNLDDGKFSTHSTKF
jgi:hypothetical protein